MGTRDRFQIPLPFTRGIVWGDPITIPPETEGEELDKKRHDVETAINALAGRRRTYGTYPLAAR